MVYGAYMHIHNQDTVGHFSSDKAAEARKVYTVKDLSRDFLDKEEANIFNLNCMDLAFSLFFVC